MVAQIRFDVMVLPVERVTAPGSGDPQRLSVALSRQVPRPVMAIRTAAVPNQQEDRHSRMQAAVGLVHQPPGAGARAT